MFSKTWTTLFETVHENVLDNGFCEFDEWYREKGNELSEVEQLKWILENPEIENSTKRVLVGKLTDKSAALEEEEDLLLKVGFEPKSLHECIKSSADAIRGRHRRDYFWFLTTGIVAMVCYIFINLLSGSSALSPTGTSVVSIIATIFFGAAMICFYESSNSNAKAENAEKEARNAYESSVGCKLQDRIVELGREREEFYELDKIIAKIT